MWSYILSGSSKGLATRYSPLSAFGLQVCCWNKSCFSNPVLSLLQRMPKNLISRLSQVVVDVKGEDLMEMKIEPLRSTTWHVHYRWSYCRRKQSNSNQEERRLDPAHLSDIFAAFSNSGCISCAFQSKQVIELVNLEEEIQALNDVLGKNLFVFYVCILNGNLLIFYSSNVFLNYSFLSYLGILLIIIWRPRSSQSGGDGALFPMLLLIYLARIQGAFSISSTVEQRPKDYACHGRAWRARSR